MKKMDNKCKRHPHSLMNFPEPVVFKCASEEVLWESVYVYCCLPGLSSAQLQAKKPIISWCTAAFNL